MEDSLLTAAISSFDVAQTITCEVQSLRKQNGLLISNSNKQNLCIRNGCRRLCFLILLILPLIRF